MKEKGFTLIELLAVIIILAVIAVITVPTVSNLIANSKIKAAESSTKAILRAAKIYYNNQEIQREPFSKTYFICNGNNCNKCISEEGNICDEVNESVFLEFEGAIPVRGIVEISATGEATISDLLNYGDGNVWVGYDGNMKLTATQERESVENKKGAERKSWIGKQIKFNPISNEVCTSGENCYTWNVMKVNSDTVDIMVNTNLGGNTDWSNCYFDNLTPGEYECLKEPEALNAALDAVTNLWKYEARIISKEEIEELLGTTIVFNDAGNGFFGISPNVATGEIKSGLTSNLAWLYVNVVDYNGYWTSSASDMECSLDGDIYNSPGCDDALIITERDQTINEEVIAGTFAIMTSTKGNQYGIRPVITVSKSLFN